MLLHTLLHQLNQNTLRTPNVVNNNSALLCFVIQYFVTFVSCFYKKKIRKDLISNLVKKTFSLSSFIEN